eukprot:SAG31_NODE_2853_length_4992_cov_5.719599_4_plen_141_part_00
MTRAKKVNLRKFRQDVFFKKNTLPVTVGSNSKRQWQSSSLHLAGVVRCDEAPPTTLAWYASQVSSCIDFVHVEIKCRNIIRFRVSTTPLFFFFCATQLALIFCSHEHMQSFCGQRRRRATMPYEPKDIKLSMCSDLLGAS